MISGQKLDKQKPMWHLLPWEELAGVVRVLTFGAKKYREGNWMLVENGEVRYLNAAHRHLAALHCGERNDPETKESHYSHAICSLMFAHWHSRRRKKCQK